MTDSRFPNLYFDLFRYSNVYGVLFKEYQGGKHDAIKI